MSLAHKILRLYTLGFPVQFGKERLIRATHRYAPTSTTNSVVTIKDGIQMQLDIQDHLQRAIYYYGVYEKDNIDLLKQRLMPGMTFVDCGANVGLYTLMAAKIMGASGQIHAFEPAPNTFESLQKNVHLNQVETVHLNQIALADSSSLARQFFVTQDNNQGSNSLSPTTEKLSPANFTVATTTVDSYFEDLTRVPDFIKIDVEGAELPTLLGAEQTILSSHPMLLLEVSDENFAAFGYSPSDLIKQIRAWGYELFEVGKQGRTVPLRQDDINYKNLFCAYPQDTAERKPTQSA